MKQSIIPFICFGKSNLLLKPVAFVLTSLALMALVSGCAGIIIDSVTRAKVTGDTYDELVNNIRSPEDGNGRIYIYRTESSTKNSLVYGIGIMKNLTFCTVDNNAFELIWESFRYYDLPIGQHDVTCGLDVIKVEDKWSGKHHFEKGVNKIIVPVSNNSEIFVRVELISEKPYYKPIIVEAEEGRNEIKSLPHQEKPMGYAKDGIVTQESKITDSIDP